MGCGGVRHHCIQPLAPNAVSGYSGQLHPRLSKEGASYLTRLEFLVGGVMNGGMYIQVLAVNLLAH